MSKKQFINAANVEVFDEGSYPSSSMVSTSRSIGEGVTTVLAGITFTLDRKLAWQAIPDILVNICNVLFSLTGEKSGALYLETQRPFAFTGGLAFTGLANDTRSIFVAGPGLIPKKDVPQSGYELNLLEILTKGKGIANKTNEGKNPDLFQISIYDSNLCYAFLNAWAYSTSPAMQNIRSYIEQETVFVNRIYFNLSITSGFVDSSLLAGEFKNQAFIQNQHNVSLIPRELLYNRKRGFEQMHTVFKRGRKEAPSTLIVGSTSQSEMLYLVPSLVTRSTAFVLNFTFVGSKNKAKEILLDLTREESLKQTNFVLAGYFFEYLARLQKGDLFKRVYETLDLLRIGNFSPRLRKPVVELGDPSLNWVKRSFTGILNTVEKNQGSLEYSMEIARFIRDAFKLIPENLSYAAIESFASDQTNKLGEKATQAIQPIREYTSALGSLVTVSVPPQLMEAKSKEELSSFLSLLISPAAPSKKEVLINNLRILVGIIEKPLVYLPFNALKLTGSRFFRLMSRFFNTRVKPEQKFSAKVNQAIAYVEEYTPKMNELFASVAANEIFPRPEFNNFIVPIVNFIISYLKEEQDRRGSKKRVDNFLMDIFLQVDPNFTRENFAQLVDETYNLKIGNVEKILQQDLIKEDQVKDIENFVRSPFETDLVFEDIKNFLQQDYSTLDRSRKYRFTSLSNEILLLRLEAVESIENLAFQMQEEATSKENIDNNTSDAMRDRAFTFYDVAANLKDFLQSLSGQGGEGNE